MCGFILADHEWRWIKTWEQQGFWKDHKVSCHVSACDKGDVYAAIPLSKRDLAADCKAARTKGCIIVSEATVDGDIIVSSVKQAYGLLLHSCYGHPCQKLCMIAITGTNGKTTVSLLLTALLEAAGRRCMTIGTNGVFIDGNKQRSTINTTPDQETLLQILLEAISRGVDTVIMEASSIGIDQYRLAGLSFDGLLFTNLGHDHLDYHGDPIRYRQTKLQLLEYRKPNAVVCMNRDDQEWAAWMDAHPHEALGYGLDDVQQVQYAMDYTTFVYQHACCLANVAASYNLSNLIGAMRMAEALGYSFPRWQSILPHLPQPEGRMERIGRNPDVIVDFAHTPQALENLLRFYRRFMRPITLVFGAGGERDQKKRPEMGGVACALADTVIITEDNSRRERLDDIISQIREGADERALVIRNRGEAINFAITNADSSAIIILAGKGNETVMIRGMENEAWDDREMAKAALRRRKRDGR